MKLLNDGQDMPDHMAEQIREVEGAVVERDGVQWDPKVHWRTKEGDLVLITTMSESHLRNTLRMLWRAADRWSWDVVLSSPKVNEGEEHAAEWAGQLGEAKPDALIRMSPLAYSGSPLLDEWDRRGFTPNSWWAR